MQMTNLPENSAVVSPSDSTDYTLGMANGFLVGVAGNVAIVHRPGEAAVVWPVVAGAPYACRHIRINSTSTTATGIVALY